MKLSNTLPLLALSALSCATGPKESAPVKTISHDVQKKVDEVNYFFDKDGDGFPGSPYRAGEKKACTKGEVMGFPFERAGIFFMTTSEVDMKKLNCISPEKAAENAGNWVTVSTEKTDCNDESNFAFPNNKEWCDGEDNNCDGQIDEACPTLDFNIENPFIEVQTGPSSSETRSTTWPIAMGNILRPDSNTLGIMLTRAPLLVNKDQFKNTVVQATLYDWALPSVKDAVSSLSETERRNLWSDLQSGVDYAEHLDPKKVDKYLKSLGSHTNLFVEYEDGPKASSALKSYEKIEAATAAIPTETYTVQDRDRIAAENPFPTNDPHRRFHAWEDRRILEGDWTKAQLISWVTQTRNDLEATLKGTEK